MMDNQPINPEKETDNYQIELLQEKLKIKRSRRKIGEVVIRKEIETQFIEIPIRQEKLIVEQIGNETKRLAEINLSRETIADLDLLTHDQINSPVKVVEGKFSSLEEAVEILAMIARQTPHGCTQVQVKLFLEDSKFEQTYQIMFQQYIEKSSNNSISHPSV
ncbi:conserved hypothetical protein [Gloeothece citriformis PCC 7424]|uniref:DUF2382 domain-containing protein n=1 Tax=Gloeothece citriformis (strain PCC 7424) TaxID=65393 RepID=B7KE63_GLOC7|nr:DUF2382 domain-containing protein [Gloeothece citriformis]ACK71761.1 conserved hypothetical protein [Gloeothece citriformis PCC 7424]